jgi:hypothetical protein
MGVATGIGFGPGLRDHRPIDCAPGIDVEITRQAVKAGGAQGDEIANH